MAVLTSGEVVIAPTLVVEVTTRIDNGALVHPVPGAVFPDVVVRPAGARAGVFRMIFSDTPDTGLSASGGYVAAVPSEAPAGPSTIVTPDGYLATAPAVSAAETAARAAFDALAAGGVWHLSAPERPSLGCRFVPVDRLSLVQGDEVRAVWVLETGYQEVDG